MYVNANQQEEQVQQYKRNLFRAAQENDAEMVRNFLQEPSLTLDLALDREKRNLLHAACLGGSTDVVEMMMSFPKVMEKIEGRDCQSRTPLHYAAAMGYDAVCQRMLNARAKIDVQDDQGATPVYLAVKFEWQETTRVLLENGANPMVEDKDGQNAVDLTIGKQSEVAELLSGFYGQRRQTTLLMSLRRLIFPSDKPRMPEWKEPAENDEAERQSPARGGPVFFDDCYGEDVPPFGPMEGEDGPGGPGSSPGGKPLSPTGIALNDFVEGGAQASRGSTGTCRLHKFFDRQVKRLEFEIEWSHERPTVGVVKPGGVADRQGLLQGDQMIEIAGKKTAGKGRDELLPLLKQRPLLLKVDRVAEVFNTPQPHVELNVSLAGSSFEEQGLEVTWRGKVPVVSHVQPNSKAWAAGLLEGDAIVRYNDKDVSQGSQAAAKSAIEDGLKTATVWRTPTGGEIGAWSGETE